jgi:hypothetical protein
MGSVLVFGVRFDPREDLAVAKAFGNFLFERFRVNPDELQKPLIERAIEVVFAVLAGDGGPAFVQHAGKDGVTAEAHARAARRALSQIYCLHWHILIFPFRDSKLRVLREKIKGRERGALS